MVALVIYAVALLSVSVPFVYILLSKINEEGTLRRRPIESRREFTDIINEKK